MNKLLSPSQAPAVEQISDGSEQVQAVVAALTQVVRSRYADRAGVADKTVSALETLGRHHTDLQQFVKAAQVEAWGHDMRAVASDLPFAEEFDAILSAAETARIAQ